MRPAVGPPVVPPPRAVNARWPGQNAEPAPEPPTEFGFDTEKLQRLLDRRDRARSWSRELSDKHRAAAELRTKLRALVQGQEQQHGRADKSTVSRLRAAEAEAERLERLREEARAESEAVVAVADACELWARARGWRPGGEAPGARVPQPPGDLVEVR
jgi:hypothetical protein